ncbi:hypothetical protein [Agromyces sp. S2-1-8]|uniref:hypothetical protein n=1 Tax=Agromyces sp. S2-1-8 TaxID=2897180 RepID=UPI001E48AEF2|nr:hypothetical protein [Agromyces sp. S2-1-8]MCD5348445.1 hypothetical protein [Agromyces sp. S2-1-8]
MATLVKGISAFKWAEAGLWATGAVAAFGVAALIAVAATVRGGQVAPVAVVLFGGFLLSLVVQGLLVLVMKVRANTEAKHQYTTLVRGREDLPRLHHKTGEVLRAAHNHLAGQE